MCPRGGLGAEVRRQQVQELGDVGRVVGEGAADVALGRRDDEHGVIVGLVALLELGVAPQGGLDRRETLGDAEGVRVHHGEQVAGGGRGGFPVGLFGDDRDGVCVGAELVEEVDALVEFDVLLLGSRRTFLL